MAAKPQHEPFEVEYDSTFGSQQRAKLYELQQSSTLTDFTIKVGKHTLQCHKVVLAAACPFFQSMIDTGLEEAKKNEVKLDSLDWRGVQDVVRYCYLGEIKVNYDQVSKLIESCEFLQLTPLKKLCEGYLIKELRADNCLGWGRFAGLYSLTQLSESAEVLTVSAFTEVFGHEEFKQLELAEVIDYIKNDKIDVLNADPILEACLDWVKVDIENRKEHLSAIIEHANIENCSATFLQLASSKNKDLFVIPSVQNLLLKTYETMALIPEQIYRMYCEDLVPLIIGGQAKNLSSQCGYRNETWLKFTDLTSGAVLNFPSICMVSGGIALSGWKLHNTEQAGCKMYDIKSKTWYSTGDLSCARWKHGSTAVGNHVFIFGGEDDNGPLLLTEALNLGRNEWTTCSESLHALIHPLFAELNMKIYVILNNCPENKDIKTKLGNTIQIYNTVRDKWTFGANLPDDLDTHGASAVAHSEAVYLVGGAGRLCNQYSPNTNSWTNLSQPSTVHVFGAAMIMNGRVLLCGGASDKDNVQGSKIKEVSEYKLEKDEWSVSDITCPYPVCYHTVAAAPLALFQ